MPYIDEKNYIIFLNSNIFVHLLSNYSIKNPPSLMWEVKTSWLKNALLVVERWADKRFGRTWRKRRARMSRPTTW